MTYSKGRQNDIKTYCFNDIFDMRCINCELRSPFYLPLNYVIEKICVYVILAKYLSFWLQKNLSSCLEEVLLYILKPI